MRTFRISAALLAVGALASAGCWSASANMLPLQVTPQAVADNLLAADRAFAEAAAKTTVIPALSSMFADDVVMQGPGGLSYGKEDAVAALSANAANAAGRLTWTPVRAGVSADGMHGFTFGFMTFTPAEGQPVPLKYLAYWIRGEGGWRVAAYKRRVRPAGEIKTTVLPASLPERLNSSPDVSRLMEHQRSLVAAERAFSDEAQQIGLGPAFEKHGWPDAMNMGGPQAAGFVLGNVEIGRDIGAGAPGTKSPVFWSAESAIVSPSGDLGVTFGHITPHPTPGTPASQPIPFFTIWRRIGGVWKYIAE